MESRTTTFTSGSDIIEITMPTLPDAGDHVEDQHHQFIADHWQGLAASACEGFRQLGPGAVVVEEPTSPASAVDNPLSAHTVRYATSEGAWLQQTFTEQSRQWLERQFQTYIPSESGLLIFLRTDTRPRLYRVGSTLSPPEALKQVRSKLN